MCRKNARYLSSKSFLVGYGGGAYWISVEEGVVCEIGLPLYGVLTAGCIDTDPPVSRGDFGQSHKPHIEIAPVHHAIWVSFSETRCEKFDTNRMCEA
jgi:hypothetical protein